MPLRQSGLVSPRTSVLASKLGNNSTSLMEWTGEVKLLEQCLSQRKTQEMLASKTFPSSSLWWSLDFISSTCKLAFAFSSLRINTFVNVNRSALMTFQNVAVESGKGMELQSCLLRGLQPNLR